MVQNIGANTSPNRPILFCKNKLACKVTIFFRIPKEKSVLFQYFLPNTSFFKPLIPNTFHYFVLGLRQFGLVSPFSFTIFPL